MDVLLAAVLTGLAVGGLISERNADGLDVVLVVLTTAPVALRQRAPVVTSLIILAALASWGLLGRAGDDIPVGGVGVLLALFTVAVLRPRWVAAAVFLIALTVTIGFVRTTGETGWPQLAQAALVLIGSWVLGEGTRRWGQRVERSAAQAAQAVADERVRIARELHDIVAHHMSVVALQSGLAEYVIDTDLPTARKALGAVGDASREALLEMRRLLDVLRVDHATDSDYSPQPGLAALDVLVERARSAGLPVEVAVTGPVRPLPPGPDLCAYRVIQESLTNVLKHAGHARAKIDLEYGEATLTVKVVDDGDQQSAPGAAVTSHGIRGMRERAELYGGVLTAGPARDGGFAVVARLPLVSA